MKYNLKQFKCKYYEEVFDKYEPVKDLREDVRFDEEEETVFIK